MGLGGWCVSSDEYKTPPRVGSNLDFSRFHPLGTHLPFSSACRACYGGGWRHLSMSWEYRLEPAIFSQTLCRIGWHHRAQVTRLRDRKPYVTYVACIDCGKRLSEPQPV